MDYVLIFIASIFLIIGFIGCFLPIVPGPPLSWLGIFALYITEKSQISGSLILVLLVITIVVTIVDYFIPIWGTKKLGGSKYGIYGSTLGLIAGLFFLPIGIIIGPIAGALIGEYVNNPNDSTKAFKSALGSFIGFVLGTGLKLGVSIIISFYFTKDLLSIFG